LAEAIRAAYAGRLTLASEAVEVLVQHPPAEPLIDTNLTDQERDVLALLAEGLSNPEIAERQNYSVAAVKYHVSNILSKFGAANRTEAVRLALEYDLLPKSKK
jgi:DNA-binding NarL/FixJ family response regulator